MPFDGIVTKCIVNELNDLLAGGRIDKVFQPESDEVVMLIRSKGQNHRLVASANANYPRLHITSTAKENPQIAPVFCMLMRKHIQGGHLINITFNDYERIITLNIESVNEMGDLSVKQVVIEIMGKHSNIILLNSDGKIIDAVKHVDSDISSVREIMPARPYSLPPAQDKISPEKVNVDQLFDNATQIKNIETLLLNRIKGFSPYICREICSMADIAPKAPLDAISNFDSLKASLVQVLDSIEQCDFKPCIVFQDEAMYKPIDFYCLPPKQYPYYKEYTHMSAALDEYYSTKDTIERLSQKKGDVVKLVKNCIDRCEKKLAIQQDKLRDVADREKLQLYGELITANIYCIPKGSKVATVSNYYSENGECIDIPLDENKTPQDNAQRYFKQYSKAKSTYTNTVQQLEESTNELNYLESVKTMLDNCNSTQEIEEIRQELADSGYAKISVKNNKKKQSKPSEPLEFTSSDGFTILVGKNNKQNDTLTLKTAASNDIWLHTKNIPGSHVIIRTERREVPDRTLLEAAILCAYHSSAKLSANVPVDYTTVRNVKKPSGAKPGMVIYENFKTINVTPSEEQVRALQRK